ncbi:hypothetical protein E6R18_15725 [Streptomyces sp. A1277]|uniref:hypothetical protein n=1 Tax=Streptomyces sp. A1277 TaxID=2563103 RepID=UPI0010A20EE1|nr:hypothetical protein [Streptomyces sp. A1277]THA31781.1 hypothetical protein E6R18_15725 [Streptomyces sp. A1277]
MAETPPITVELPPVPSYVTRDTLRDICRTLGLDPANVREIRLDVHEVTATLLLCTPDGCKIRYGDGAATTTVTIPIS